MFCPCCHEEDIRCITSFDGHDALLGVVSLLVVIVNLPAVLTLFVVRYTLLGVVSLLVVIVNLPAVLTLFVVRYTLPVSYTHLTLPTTAEV